MMQKNTRSLVILLTTFLSALNIYSQNLLSNGDFESGGNGVGFNVNSSFYNEIGPAFSGTTTSGNYAVTTNPQPMNTSIFLAGGDHTTGAGKMLVVDGTTTGGSQRFWRAGNNGDGACCLTVGLTYTFSYWIKTISNIASFANIGYQFNNTSNVVLVSGSATAPAAAAGWQKVVYTFTATSASVNIELWDNNINAVGNDFAVDDFSLLAPPLPLSLNYSLTKPSCPGDTNGMIVGYPKGGTAPYTFTLTPSGATNSSGVFTGLIAGTYNLSVTDNAGASVPQNITVPNPTDLTVTASTTICSGSSIPLSVSGTSNPVTWTASPADASLTTPNATNPVVSPTVTTTYTVTSNTTNTTDLIFNGDFSLGTGGFTSDYTYFSPTNPSLAQRTYGVVTNPNTWESGFSACPDHTTGTGNMMVVDGSATNGGNDKVWCQTIPVTPGQTYTMTYLLTSLSASNQANIQVMINGANFGSAFMAPFATCNWSPRSATWNSGASTTAEICIYDRNTSSAGNDFALDDITFTGAINCTLTKTVTITVVSGITLNITNPVAVCSPNTVDISAAAVTAGSTTGTVLTYWTNATATNPLANYTAITTSGTYYITSTLGTCTLIKPVTVTVNTGASVAAPGVIQPLRYCQSATVIAPALTATTAPGATLNWYTTQTGGIATHTAPIPSITAVGATSWYVSQSIGLCEGPRVELEVIVSSGSGNLNLHCDYSQVTTTTSLFFDWDNVPNRINYNFSYSIDGGAPITGNTALTHWEVFGLVNGQSVTFTITSVVGVPCQAAVSTTCTLCSSNPLAVFASIPTSICSGSVAPTLALVSDNGISGTWSPATVSNTTGGNYIFTPNPALFPCAVGVTKGISVATPPNGGTLSGIQNVCVGGNRAFATTGSGGTWTSSNTSIATVVGTTGLVTGVSAGIATITYTVLGTGGCPNATPTRTITVDALPSAGTLSGTQNVCIGLTRTFTSTVLGGNWTSSNAAFATIDPTTGIITGVAVGTATISYVVTNAAGCTSPAVTRTITVDAIPNAGTLSGDQNVCFGFPRTFTSTVLGGNWTSSNPAIATINATTGVITTIAVGSTTISYIVTSAAGCVSPPATRPLIVNAIPSSGVLSGVQNVCVGSHRIFSSSAIGGIWTSSNPGVATISGATGDIFGIAPGTATMTYIVTGVGNCTSIPLTRTITVNPNVTPTFTQVAAICSGSVLAALPTTSLEGITGTWTPVINNTATTLYTFTPTAGLCATTATMTITVNQKITPSFGTFSIQCQNDPNVPILPTVSQNGITGTWSPAVVNLSAIGTTAYTFIPTLGQCVTAAPVQVSITVVVVTTPNFTNYTFCNGKTPIPTLDTTSPNGVEGTWSPPVISNTVSGNYVFTPNAGQCGTVQTISVTVIPKTIPDFPAIAPFCVAATVPVLGNISPNGVNGTWSPALIDNTIAGTTAYVFTPNTNECATTQTLNITVTPPVEATFRDIILCEGVLPPVLAAVSPNGISGTWMPPTIDSNIVGVSPYVFTPDAGECGLVTTINVTVNEYTLNKVEGIVSNYFDDLQVITVLASGPGSYAYQLDHGPIQETNVFQNVEAGMHTITVFDRNNCGPSLSNPNIMVINYPNFFTPNGDGFNDTWNIFGLSDQLDATIFIFDRYGKLMKEISPMGTGWDGIYNGNPAPSTDYWFLVNYTENGAKKEFRAHFSLKR